jgi:hypothetical protein
MRGARSAHWGDEKCIKKFWSEDPKGRELGRRRSRRVDNIRMDLRDTVWEMVEWIHLAQNTNQ